MSLEELFESSDEPSLEERVLKALKGLKSVISYEISGNQVSMWKKTPAYNLTEVLIKGMRREGFEIYIVSVSNETVGMMGGGYTHKPMIVFKDKGP